MVEFRKLISFGKTSFIISLPKAWVVKNNLVKGDLIAVEEDNGQLVLSPGSQKGKEIIKKGKLDLTNLPTLKRRLICAAYLKGYDELEIIYDKPDYIQVIQKTIPEFAGYDIIKQGTNRCIIKQISKPTQNEFENVLNRLFLILLLFWTIILPQYTDYFSIINAL